MSSRNMKKVFGNDNGVVEGTVGTISSDDEVPFPLPLKSKSKKTSSVMNPFQLLNELEKTEEEGRSSPQEDADEEGDDGKESHEDDHSTPLRLKKKKKRKNKNRKQDQVQKPTEGSSGSAPCLSLQGLSIDELAHKQESKLRESLVVPSNEMGSSSSSDTCNPGEAWSRSGFERLFSVEPKRLNPDYELKKIFGAKVVNYERGGKYGHRRGGGFRSSNRLIDPKPNWTPPMGSGLSMSFLGHRFGSAYFKFNHSPTYQSWHTTFMLAVNTLNPEHIVNLLRTHPHHIDSHIQLSDVAKGAEDMQVAAELVETALYYMESVVDARFSLSHPSCRLEYKYQENRAFHILLFKHLNFVGSRACHRTALELAKRLLTLDPKEDPLCATLLMDFYAIKAGECQWLCDVFKFWEPTRNLSQLPNWAYSVALAKYLLSIGLGDQATLGRESKVKQAPKPLTSEEKAQLDELSKSSDELLQHAILMFPSVLLPLLDKCGVHCDSRVKNHSYLNYMAENSQSPALKLLCDLYVWRNHHVWRDPHILSWVERNVNLALDKIDGNKSLGQEYDALRRRRYQGTPRNILRHVFLTDNKDLTMHLSADLSKEPILSYDPLPPPDSIDIYKYKSTQGRSSNHRTGILSMLFRSLVSDLNEQAGALPDPAPALLQQLNEAQEAHERNLVNAEQGGEEQAAGAGVAGLQQSVTVLLDAMRELLSNVAQRGAGHEGHEEVGDPETDYDE